MRAVKIITVLSVVLFGAVASAQTKKEEAKTKTLNFEADDITGDLIRPDGEGINVRDFANASSLIRIRRDFIAEIVKSAENLL